MGTNESILLNGTKRKEARSEQKELQSADFFSASLCWDLQHFPDFSIAIPKAAQPMSTGGQAQYMKPNYDWRQAGNLGTGP